MNITIDANVLFAALIRDSETRRILLHSQESFFAPEAVFAEMGSHYYEIRRRAGLSARQFALLLHALTSRVHVVPDRVLEPHLLRAWEIIRDIDMDDAPYLTCALAIPECLLWSNDERLKGQGAVRVLNTKELLERL